MTMKKLISVLLFLSVIPFAFSQSEDSSKSGVKEIFTTFGGTVKSKNIIVKGGIGLDTNMIERDGYFIPCVGLSGEYTLQCGPVPLGFGLFAEYSGRSNYSYYSLNGYNSNRKTEYNNYLACGVFVNYHVNIPVKNLDLYLGPKVGVNIDFIQTKNTYIQGGRWQESKENSTDFALYLGGTLGASWYFTEKIGANLEVGYPVFAKINASVKF